MNQMLWKQGEGQDIWAERNGNSKSELNEGEQEGDTLKKINGLRKGSLVEQQESDNIVSSKISRDLQSSFKDANSSIRKERKIQQSETAVDFVCWKSPYDEEEICFPGSEVPNDPNVKHKKKYVRQPIYDVLTCPTCGKLYANPQILPCNHNICESCIAKQKEISKRGIMKHAVVTCPVCQEKHYFTSSEKVKFPTNFLLNEVLNRVEKRGKKFSRKSTIKQQRYCQLCEKKSRRLSVKKCETCNLNFCKDCLKQHNKTYTDHSFIEPSGGELQMQCFDHPDTPLTAFCMADKVPICEECTNEKHKNHQTGSIEDAFKDQAIHLFHTIAKYGKAKDESENDMLKLSIFKSTLQDNRNKFQKQVYDEFQTLHNYLKLIEKQVKAIYDSELNMKIADINNFMAATAKHISNTEGLVQYAKEAAKETDEFVLLQTVNHLINQLKEKANGINMSDKELMINPATSFDFRRFSEQMNQIFQPISEKYQKLRSSKSSSTFRRNNISPVEAQPEILKSTSEQPEMMKSEIEEIKSMEPEIKESKTKQLEESSSPSAISQETISEVHIDNKGSIESIESKHSAKDNDQMNTQEQDANIERPVPPTIYHHIVNRTTAKIFWMVPEQELVDSFDVHLQEVGYDNEIATPQQMGVVFSGISASSFETTLKENVEIIFKVRAVNANGESSWSYPYRTWLIHSSGSRVYLKVVGSGKPAENAHLNAHLILPINGVTYNNAAMLVGLSHRTSASGKYVHIFHNDGWRSSPDWKAVVKEVT